MISKTMSDARNTRMQILSGLVVPAVLMGMNAFAQSGTAPTVAPVASKAQTVAAKNVIDSRIERLSKQLDLTAEQQAAIRPIMEDEVNKLKVLRRETGLNETEHRAKLHELRQDTSNKMRSVLTPEQQQKYESYRKELRERYQKRVTNSPAK